MSEFVECQNCGRRFFAENVDCPYCGGQDEDTDDAKALVEDLMRTVAPSTPSSPPPAARSGLFAVLFAGFALLAAAIGVWALAAAARTADPAVRIGLGLEATWAFGAAAAVWRRWPRARAIAVGFIAANAILGIVSLFSAGPRPFVAFGAGPAALLLFAWPFLAKEARDRFPR